MISLALIEPSLPTPDEWDEFGSRQRFLVVGALPCRSLVSLEARVLPAPSPSGYHYYRDDNGNLCQASYTCSTFQTGARMEDVDQALQGRGRGVTYLYAVLEDPARPGMLMLRAAFTDYSVESSVLEPMPARDLLIEMAKPRVSPIDRGRYPGDCPACGGPAYIGLNEVDCAAGCRG